MSENESKTEAPEASASEETAAPEAEAQGGDDKALADVAAREEKPSAAEARPAGGGAGPVVRGSVGSFFSNTSTIASREFGSYFSSALGYIVIGMFLLLVGFLVFFPFAFLVIGKASLQPMFNSISWLLPLISPAIAMRTFAEEKRTGTLEMLITQPVRDWEVILGKYLGALGLLAVCITATLTYPFAISRMGELDWGPVIGGYIGLFLGGASYVAFGVMVSSYTKDQITAFFVAFIVGALFFLLNKALIFFGGAATVLEYLCPDYHFTSIARGVIDARNIIYFVSVISVSLMATARSLDSRRWS
ncbi:MAG: ABC transporter permease subunit [Myxococcales bacterium]|nr:ABC transporter permease subunit [Myxococcales bacterium]